MATATYTSDLTDIFLFESTTGVSAYGGGAAGLGASPDYAIEGTNAVDKQVSAAEKGFMYDNSTNFSIGPNDHFFIWVVCAVPGLVDTRDNRGVHVSIGDSTSAFVKFHVNGGDTKPRGGISPYAVRYVETTLANRRTLVGSPGTTPSWIGGGANVTGTAKFSNFACDAARIGTGYDITGGDGIDADATFAGLATDDESTSEGVCQNADGGYSIQGKIRIGNSGTACVFTDSNTNLVLIDTLDGIALSDLTEFIVSDDTTVWTLTNVNFIPLGTNNPGRLENVTPLITAQDETSYDNSPTSEGTFAGGTGHAASDVITLDDDWTTVTVDAVSGGVVTQFTVNSTRGRSAVSGTAMTQSSTTGSGTGFSLTPDTDNILGAGTITFVNVGFIGFGDTILSSNDSLTGGRWINSGQVTANGAVLTNNTFTGYEGTANTSYLIWNVNSDPDGELDGSSFTKGTAATHAIEFGLSSPTVMTIRNCDFSGYNASNANNDSTFHFLRTTGDVTLNLVNVTGNVSYRTAGANITIVQDPVTITVNASDVGTGLPVAGARVLVTPTTTTVVCDDYDGVNADFDAVVGNNTTTAVGQSFTGDGNVLSGLKATLRRTLTPPGSVIARLYAHTGTYGTSSEPTGAPLDSSEVIPVASLTTSDTEYTFVFNGGVTLTNGTNYFMAIEYTLGGSGDNVISRVDITSPTHSGNFANRSTAGTWTTSSTVDLAGWEVQTQEYLGPLPYRESVTITRVSTTASVAHTAHGLSNGQKVLIADADQDEYNGVKTISNVTTNAYDFTVSGSPTTPATGTIISTAVIIEGTTDGDGSISDTRAYASNQQFSGRVRDSSTSPFYKSSRIGGVIDSSVGISVNVPMISDE